MTDSPTIPAQTAVPVEAIATVRRFSRFYTRQLGLLGEGLLHSAFSLPEARILYELAHRDGLTATALGQELGLDAGYLSRILKRFTARGLVAREASANDGRQMLLAITEAGRQAFAPLDRASQQEIATMLGRLPPSRIRQLTQAMAVVEQAMGGAAPPAMPYLLRPHRVGDIGWVAHRQGILYAREYGWDESFEALVAEIAASFVRNFDAKRERCWIAERDGDIVGSVFLVRASDDVAKLRLLYVEPSARGLGIGQRLTEECIRFARDHGYKTLVLWTNDILIAARRIYQAAGFTLVAEEKHHSFGHDLVGQNWELAL